jgi:hypothetical protein
MKTHASGGSTMAMLVALLISVVPPGLGGQAADPRAIEAEFLAQAERGAEQQRKGEAVLHFTDGRGRPLVNASVQIRQTGHEFLFGCIGFELVRSERLPNPDLWKQRFRELFNFAVFPFYWASYEPQPGKTMREDYEPKPVYTRLKDLIHRQWRTELTARTDEKGQVTFRGFYGSYRITLTTAEGRQQEYQITLHKGGQNQWDFK